MLARLGTGSAALLQSSPQLSRQPLGRNKGGHRLKKWVVVVALALLVMTLAFVNRKVNPLPYEAKADSIVVNKGERTLMLFAGGKVLKSYSVSLGSNPAGEKLMEGDGKTPEGLYVVDYRNKESRFHLSLHISYPDSAAIMRAKMSDVSPGGMIMIHGLRNGIGWIGRLHLLFDWTDGCIAVTNPEIEEIWGAVPNGVPITINP